MTGINIMIQVKEKTTGKEIRRLTESRGDKVFISRSAKESIFILTQNEIHKAVVHLEGFSDASVLQYINDHSPGTEVVVLTKKRFDNMLSLFRNPKYSVIYEPGNLNELLGIMPKGKNLA
jgi:hypothetical protein